MFGSAGGGDLESLARQYWEAWGQAIRAGTTAAPESPGVAGNASAQAWAAWFAQDRPHPFGEVLQRFNGPVADWYGRMQQVAAQFAGQDNSASAIGRAWREALGGGAAGINPFADIFDAMSGWGRHGIDDGFAQVADWLELLYRSAGEQSAPPLPMFGPAREHQQRWQALMRVVQEYRQRNNEYNALLLKVGERAFAVFEAGLARHEAANTPISSARALFDLWIDAAEEAYAEEAGSEAFRHAIGALANAQMRLRAAVQTEVEHASRLFGVPTRTEVDAAYRKIAELQRELRRVLKSRPGDTGTDDPAPEPTKTARPATRTRRTAAPARSRPAASSASAPTKASVRPARGAAKLSPKTAKAAVRKSTRSAKPAGSRSSASMKDWVARSMASIAPPTGGGSQPTGRSRRK